MKKTLFLLTPITIFILALSSCGQTGDLYLPKSEVASSGSTIATSGSTIAASGSAVSTKDTNKVDNDPSSPARSSDPEATELVDTGDGFGFQKSIQNSTSGGGAPD